VQGHNRWHPDVEPALVVRPGEVVSLDAPLGTGDQIGRESVHADLLALDFSQDLLAGPVYVEGAEPGDVLVVEIREVTPADFGFSAIFPGFGLLADVIPGPYLSPGSSTVGTRVPPSCRASPFPAGPFPGTDRRGTVARAARTRSRPRGELSQRAGLDLAAFSPPAIPAEAAGRARHVAAARDRRQRRRSRTSAPDLGCCCPFTCRVRCCRSVTCTSRTARARSAEAQSRSARR
jgi:formamidase